MAIEPEFFGKYILLERLAAGGMAEVYLAKSQGVENVSKFFAVKRILPKFSQDASFIEMFKEEAKIAINLDHTNVVSIIEFGEERGQFFIVMEFVEGKNLREILHKIQKASKRLSIEHIVYIINQVANGLDYAHRSKDKSTDRALNITHRDISPQNVMISFEGSVKICDFGIAKAESKIESTQAGTLKGKYGYMSPEQVEGVELDYRTDIFSLGIVLWELLANERLFYASNELNTLRKIQECDIKSLRKIDPNIPPELERITNKALAKDRNYRYQSANELHRDLNRFLNQNYPDFSPQDFAVLMSQMWLNEREELRKRMVDYARIQAGRPVPEKTVIEHSVTRTISEFDSTRNDEPLQIENELPPPHSISIKVDPNNDGFWGTNGGDSGPKKHSGSISNSSSAPRPPSEATDWSRNPKTNSQPPPLAPKPSESATVIQPSPKEQATVVGRPDMFNKETIVSPSSSQSHQQPKTPLANRATQAPSPRARAAVEMERLYLREGSYNTFSGTTTQSWTERFLSVLVVFFIVSGVSTVMLLYFRNHPDQIANVEPVRPLIEAGFQAFGWKPLPTEQDPHPNGVETIASRIKTIQIFVTSVPAGADIFVNNAPTQQITPASIQVPAGTPFKLMLSKRGFGQYTKDYTFTEAGGEVRESLHRVDLGYISVELRLHSENTKIYINGEEINQKAPIVEFPVPAGRIHVLAHDEFSHTSSEETVEVGPETTRSVVLILNRPDTADGLPKPNEKKPRAPNPTPPPTKRKM